MPSSETRVSINLTIYNQPINQNQPFNHSFLISKETDLKSFPQIKIVFWTPSVQVHANLNPERADMSQKGNNLSQIPLFGKESRTLSCDRNNKKQTKIKDRVNGFEQRGRDKEIKTNVNGSNTKIKFCPKPIETEEAAKVDLKETKGDEPKEANPGEDKLDLILAMMRNQDQKLTNHINKHDQDIKRINDKLELIQTNSERIQANTDDIVDLVVAVEEVNTRVEQVEEDVNSKVAEVERENAKILKELEARPSNEQIEEMIKKRVESETGHLVMIMKNLIQETKKTSYQASMEDFPNLEKEADRPIYAEVANYSVGSKNPYPTVGKQIPVPSQNRKTIRNNFEETNNQESLIMQHKQIVGIKPVIRKHLDFHARTVGIANPEAITDSKIFYCPTYFNFRISFAYNYLYEVFGLQKDEVNITDVKMCTKLSAQIMWITIGENSARHLFGLASRIQRNDLSVIQSIPPNMIERRKAISKKLKQIKEINPNLRYQIRLGKTDFRILSKNYKPTEYTRYREVAMSVIDPLDEFPRPNNAVPNTMDDSHAKVIADAIKNAKEAAAKSLETEWNTVGKRLLSPEKIERNIRKKLSSPAKVNEALQRIITGKKTLDLGDFGTDVQKEVEEMIGTTIPTVLQPAHLTPTAPPVEDASTPMDGTVEEASTPMEERIEDGSPTPDDKNMGRVNYGASVSGSQL